MLPQHAETEYDDDQGEEKQFDRMDESEAPLGKLPSRAFARRVRRVKEEYAAAGGRDAPSLQRLYEEYRRNNWLKEWGAANERIRRASARAKESQVFTLKRQPLLGVPPLKGAR